MLLKYYRNIIEILQAIVERGGGIILALTGPLLRHWNHRGPRQYIHRTKTLPGQSSETLASEDLMKLFFSDSGLQLVPVGNR